MEHSAFFYLFALDEPCQRAQIWYQTQRGNLLKDPEGTIGIAPHGIHMAGLRQAVLVDLDKLTEDGREKLEKYMTNLC
jgi:hypothetical protein